MATARHVDRAVQKQLRELRLGRLQLFVEIARPWLLLASYVALAHWVHILVALPFAFATCLAAFVLMHDAMHESLGLGKRAHAVILTTSAQLILKSGHALRATHLRHHGKCLGEDDPEGAPAHWSLARVLFAGPFHILAMRGDALRIAPRTRGIQLLETACTAAVLAAMITTYVLWHTWIGLVYWVAAALVSATMPLWAAYVPHRLAPSNPVVRAAGNVAQLWTPILTSFAYHHVHHTYPRVPTALLPRVASELGEDGLATVHVHVPSE